MCHDLKWPLKVCFRVYTNQPKTEFQRPFHSLAYGFIGLFVGWQLHETSSLEISYGRQFSKTAHSFHETVPWKSVSGGAFHETALFKTDLQESCMILVYRYLGWLLRAQFRESCLSGSLRGQFCKTVPWKLVHETFSSQNLPWGAVWSNWPPGISSAKLIPPRSQFSDIFNFIKPYLHPSFVELIPLKLVPWNCPPHWKSALWNFTP